MLIQKKKNNLSIGKKVCKSFLKLSYKTKIYVHSNKKFKGENSIKYFHFIQFKKIKRHPSILKLVL